MAFFRKRRIFDLRTYVNTFMVGHCWQCAQMTSSVSMTGLNADCLDGLMLMSKYDRPFLKIHFGRGFLSFSIMFTNFMFVWFP